MDNKLKGTLTFIFYYFLIQDVWQRWVYTSLFILTGIRSQTKRELILRVLIVLLSLIEQQPLIYTKLLASMGIFFFEFSQNLMKQCLEVFSKIKNLVLTMAFIFCLSAYLGIYLYRSTKYFPNFAQSTITLLQVQTLDDWGKIGRIISTDESDFPQMFFVTFIFLMTYFYMNVMIGLILTEQKNKDDYEYFENYQEAILKQIYRHSCWDHIFLGRFYEFLVYFFSFGTVLFTIYNQFEEPDTKLEIIISIVDDFAYTFHFLIILFVKGKLYKLERQSMTLMSFHFLSGPLSLLASLFWDSSIGSFFNLLKVATTPSIKGIFRGTFQIFPMLLPQFIQLMGVIMIIATWFSYSSYMIVKGNLQYFISFWDSFYTMIQIMTLDDWCAGLCEQFEKEGIISSRVIMPIFIFISNFIILNTLIALSCEYFEEVKAHRVFSSKEDQKRQNIMPIGDVEVIQEGIRKELSEIQKVYVTESHSITNEESRLINSIKNSEIVMIKYGKRKCIVRLSLEEQKKEAL